MAEPCASFLAGRLLCADGFPQRPFCSGTFGCHACGHADAATLPACITEQFIPHLMDDAGVPKFRPHKDTPHDR